MIPEAHVSHQMSGRLRIKIPSKKGDSSYFAALPERLSGCTGIGEIAVNPQTGSALILYECETSAIARYARDNDLFVLRRSTPARKTLFDHVADTFGAYNAKLRQMTDGQVDLPTLVFSSLLVSGIYQLARGNFVMPAWYTAFYYALGVFTRAQAEEWDEGEDVLEGADDGD
ncbi:MAG: hypothetical protein HY914_12990 [Desulfomonile tiedjei]|nr:hypothetical protein [Desulfomonile tiedjei]